MRNCKSEQCKTWSTLVGLTVRVALSCFASDDFTASHLQCRTRTLVSIRFLWTASYISIWIDSKVSRRAIVFRVEKLPAHSLHCASSLRANCPVGLVFSFLIVFCTCVIASIILLIPSRSVAIFCFLKENSHIPRPLSTVEIINLFASFSLSLEKKLSFEKIIVHIQLAIKYIFHNILRCVVLWTLINF